MLATLHNVWFYLDIMRRIRQSILLGNFPELLRATPQSGSSYFKLRFEPFAASHSGIIHDNWANMLVPAFLPAPSGSPGGNFLSGILPIVLMFGIAYFLIFLPVQRQRKQQKEMLKGLQNGQTVLTSGGIVGTIIAVNSDDTLILRVKPDNLKLQVSRSSVTSLVTGEGQSAKK